MPRVSGSLVVGPDLQDAVNDLRLTGNGNIPTNQKVLDGNELNAAAFFDALAYNTRCPSWDELQASYEAYYVRYGTTLSNAQFSVENWYYITLYYGWGTNCKVFTGTDILRADVAPNGYYIYNGASWQITGSNGIINVYGGTMPNSTLQFDNAGITGSSASANFGGLWSTGLRAAGSGMISNTTTSTGNYTFSTTRSTGGTAQVTAQLLKNGRMVQSKPAPINTTTTFSAVTVTRGDVWKIFLS